MVLLDDFRFGHVVEGELVEIFLIVEGCKPHSIGAGEPLGSLQFVLMHVQGGIPSLLLVARTRTCT